MNPLAYSCQLHQERREMTDPVRYGYYLRPSPEMCAAQVRLHSLLSHQYGLQVAGRFMPHCTVKGFFRSNASEEEIRARAATITAGAEAFAVASQGVVPFGDRAIVLPISGMPDGSKNVALQSLHEKALEALLPIVSLECPHTPTESLGERFHAHLTLAMADIPAPQFDEILAFCQELEPIGPATFMAERLHLFAFDSDDWDGAWWESFRWRLVDSWRLES